MPHAASGFEKSVVGKQHICEVAIGRGEIADTDDKGTRARVLIPNQPDGNIGFGLMSRPPGIGTELGARLDHRVGGRAVTREEPDAQHATSLLTACSTVSEFLTAMSVTEESR